LDPPRLGSAQIRTSHACRATGTSASARRYSHAAANGGVDADFGRRQKHREFSMSYIKLEHGIWVLIADGEKALFLKNEGDTKYPNLTVFRELQKENPPTRDQGSDRPGRFNDGPNIHKSAVADTDWHRIAKERFADEIAERLYKFAHHGDFEKIILVAPPAVLGEMRKQFHKEVIDRIAAEVPKTLTNHPVPEIEKLLLAA
jgi:protein required for attachment to host cells